MRKKQFRLKPICASLLLAFTTHTAHANPIGAAVDNGQASFATSGKTLTVTNTPGTIINWQGFSIGSGETTRFIQQSASSAILNRVVGPNPSALLGAMSSNGRVFLINPTGILVGQGARIDVAGFVASTLNLSNADFLAGKLNFTPALNAGVVRNDGSITTPEGGTVYLVGARIENNGIINTPKGETILSAGNTVQLIDTGTPGVTVKITGAGNAATNLGQILADSGRIGMVGAVVRNSGTISANSLVAQGGKIFLRATSRVEAGGTISAQGVGGGNIAVLADMQTGTTNITGSLDASAPNKGNGGFIETSAAHVNIADTTRVTTASAMGLSGNWLIDPFDFTIAAIGGNMTGAALTTSLTGGNVTIQSTIGTTGTLGDVNVNDIVTWSANKLTLNAQNNININAAMNGSGTASLALLYGQSALAAGNLSTYNIHTAVNLPAGANFSTLLGSNGVLTNYIVITALGAAGSTTATDLQGINGGLTGKYVLGANIDATATSAWNAGSGFTPIGNATTQFTGMLDGLGHTVSNLTINLPTTNYVGLFGDAATGSVIRNVGISGGSVSGNIYVGGLVGYNAGTIYGSYNTGSVSGTQQVGGLVGQNAGASSSISNSYATGNLSGGSFVGGLVGINSGAVSNSYAIGNVTGTGTYVGGLVGGNAASSMIDNVYSAGTVLGAGLYVGALVGINDGVINNGVWSIDSNVFSGTARGVGGGASPVGTTGLTNAEMVRLVSYSGWNSISNVGGSGSDWRIYEGITRPLLTKFLTPLILTDAPDVTVAYDGFSHTGGLTANGAVAVNTLVGSPATGALPGIYSSYYSTQQGYDIVGGNLIITSNAAFAASPFCIPLVIVNTNLAYTSFVLKIAMSTASSVRADVADSLASIQSSQTFSANALNSLSIIIIQENAYAAANPAQAAQAAQVIAAATTAINIINTNVALANTAISSALALLNTANANIYTGVIYSALADASLHLLDFYVKTGQTAAALNSIASVNTFYFDSIVAAAVNDSSQAALFALEARGAANTASLSATQFNVAAAAAAGTQTSASQASILSIIGTAAANIATLNAQQIQLLNSVQSILMDSKASAALISGVGASSAAINAPPINAPSTTAIPVWPTSVAGGSIGGGAGSFGGPESTPASNSGKSGDMEKIDGSPVKDKDGKAEDKGKPNAKPEKC